MTMIRQAIRKIIGQSDGALTITLPPEWTQKHGLGKGNYVRLEEEGEALRVIPIGEQEVA